MDTRITSIAWFGALNEVVARWLLADKPGGLEDAYPALRAALLRSAGVPEARIGDVPVSPPRLVVPGAVAGGRGGPPAVTTLQPDPAPP